MLRALPWLFLVACAQGIDVPPEPGIPTTDLFEQVWTETIRSHDVIVAVPGTGGYSTLGKYIEETVDPTKPETFFDARSQLLAVQVLEEAIAAAQRAGFTGEQLEAGEIELAVWGMGITKLDEFRYLSVGGFDVTFSVIGGTSVCANGGIFENLVNYNEGNASKDAGDLYRRTKQWLDVEFAAGSDRNVILVSHSWGGVVAEYLTSHFASFAVANGEWDASLAFTIAGGVPGMVPGYASFGPGFRTVTSEAGERVQDVRTYELARPDDPIRTLDPNGDGNGHNYIIVVDGEYKGWYGITTDELSCHDAPGACQPKQ